MTTEVTRISPAIGFHWKTTESDTHRTDHNDTVPKAMNNEEPNTTMSVSMNLSAIPRATLLSIGAGSDPRAGRVPQGDVLHGVVGVQLGNDETSVRLHDSASWEGGGYGGEWQ